MGDSGGNWWLSEYSFEYSHQPAAVRINDFQNDDNNSNVSGNHHSPNVFNLNVQHAEGSPVNFANFNSNVLMQSRSRGALFDPTITQAFFANMDDSTLGHASEKARIEESYEMQQNQDPISSKYMNSSFIRHEIEQLLIEENHEMQQDQASILNDDMRASLDGHDIQSVDSQEDDGTQQDRESVPDDDMVNLMDRRRVGAFTTPRKKPRKKASSKSHKDYSLKPCDCANCPFHCKSNVSEKKRGTINCQFWKLRVSEQHLFVARSLLHVNIKKRKRNRKSDKRKRSTNFFLVGDDNRKHRVCKKFFLTTLGYKPNNDAIIKAVCEKYSIEEQDQEDNEEIQIVDKRGKHERDDTVERNGSIFIYVMKFGPSISHYKRVNSPFRLYLPSDLNIKLLSNDFIAENPSIPCTYEQFRLMFNSMNIAFTQLGNEQCELCQIFELHPHTLENLDLSCTECCDWDDHIKRAVAARNEYKLDKKNSYAEKDAAYFSSDLEKVTYLPRMECFKSALHSPRVHAFNQTFAPLGNRREEAPVIACLWHDGIAGRKKEEIISTFHHFFICQRDKKKIVVWLDNCGGQNKNWALLTFLVYSVNGPAISEVEIIEFKYFETGHTFMSADSYHADVERKLKQSGQVYDFTDFVACAQSASEHLSLKVMDIESFHDWEDHSSLVKIQKSLPRPYLGSIKHIQARRGDYCLYYKTCHDEMAPYIQMNFLKNAVMKKGFFPAKKRTMCQGIDSDHKDEIVKKLCPLMEESRRQFFFNLPVKPPKPKAAAKKDFKMTL